MDSDVQSVTEKFIVPDYLYYYTDIDTLALILKNHTIRLNSLDKMDDKQEQMSKDKQNFGKFVFISSWTEDEVESIPMWRMYTPKGRGVRVTLKTNPFKNYEIDPDVFAKALGITNVSGDGASNFKLVIPTEHYVNDIFTVFNYSENNQLVKIVYTDDERLLNPTLLLSDQKGTSIEIGKLGLYKNTYWSFQKEWRYRLLFSPIPLKSTLLKGLSGDYSELAKFAQMSLNGTASLPFNYYDLYIRDDCYADMSIVLSPDITESARMFANMLVEKYNPQCTIEQSVLTNLIQ